jgi:hypothetical protein
MVLVTVAGFLGYSAFAERVSEQENNLKDYRQAEICQVDGCRKIVDATIVNTKTEFRIHVFFPKHRDMPLRDPELWWEASRYLITLALPDSNLETIEFSSGQKYHAVFSLSNIYFPTGRTFADDNFSSGQTVKIEIWNNQITFVLLDSVRNYELPEKLNTHATPEANGGPRISTLPASQTLQYSNKIAIPTNNHPVISLENAKSALERLSTAFVMAFFLIPAFFGLFLSVRK